MAETLGMRARRQKQNIFGFPLGYFLQSIVLGDTFPGFDSTVIPLIVTASLTASGSRSAGGDASNTGTWSDTKKYTLNSNDGLKVDASGHGEWRQGTYTRINGLSNSGRTTGTGYGIWLPPLFGYDYDLLKETVTSGTVTAWLKKGSGDKHTPKGMWKLKSTKNGDSWTGYTSNVIPLTAQYSASSYAGYLRGSGQDYADIPNANYDAPFGASRSENGKTIISLSGSASTSANTEIAGNGGAGVYLSGSVTIYEAFLPYFYNFDYTALQNNYSKGGTVVEWLEKQS